MSSYNDVNPTLTSWRKTSRGHIEGRVFNHPRFKDGTYIRVKPVSTIYIDPSNTNLLKGYLLVICGSNNYCLGSSKSTERKWKAEREENKAEHQDFLSKMAALMASATATIDPTTPVTGGDATFVEVMTGNHDDKDNVPASMAQLHHNFLIIQQAFEDVVKTPTKPTTIIKVGTLLDPEDNDESISRPIQPDSDALDKLRRHLAHTTNPTTSPQPSNGEHTFKYHQRRNKSDAVSSIL